MLQHLAVGCLLPRASARNLRELFLQNIYRRVQSCVGRHVQVITVSRHPHRKSVTYAVAGLAWLFFLLTTFRYGWTRAASDFPNYYTAAVLVRKGEPLRNYYDWTWFERQVHFAGSEQLGAYVPQGPLTMTPLIPVTGLPVQAAKRVWITFSLICLIATFWLLSRMTRFTIAEISLLCFLGYGTLHFNFLYGQYYVFLLFLFVLAWYAIRKSHEGSSGLIFGAIFALKLYGGPFLLYFAVKRRWKAVAAMLAASLGLGLLAVALFGWNDIAHFGTQILPRALRGETLDPYNSLNGTVTTLLRRALMMEPELNPRPLWNAPALFFFLQPLLTLAVLVFPLLALSRSEKSARDFAWFFIAVMIASPNTGSYTFILLLLPVALLLEDASRREQILLIACYALLAVPLHSSWSWLFPKVWLLIILFIIAGRGSWRIIRPEAALVAAAAVVLAATVVAVRSLAAYSQEPGRRWQAVAVEKGEMLSTSPAILRSGMMYQAIGRDRYVLRWAHEGRIQEFRFAGEALRPEAETPDGPIRFELVRGKQSTEMLLDPIASTLTRQSTAKERQAAQPVLSPDGKWIAFVQAAAGGQQIWLKSARGGLSSALTGGNCNSSSPVWDLDSKSIVFASDCDRGVGCPALYRACLTREWLSGDSK